MQLLRFGYCSCPNTNRREKQAHIYTYTLISRAFRASFQTDMYSFWADGATNIAEMGLSNTYGKEIQLKQDI